MHMQQNIDRKQNYAHNTRPYPTMNIDNAEISILCYAKVVYGDFAILLSCHDSLQYGLSITITSSYGGR